VGSYPPTPQEQGSKRGGRVPGSVLSDQRGRKQDLGEDRGDGENRHLEILHLQSPVYRQGPVPRSNILLQRSNT
jgi:hypothetical protein